jgi:hypothetical protein
MTATRDFFAFSPSNLIIARYYLSPTHTVVLCEFAFVPDSRAHSHKTEHQRESTENYPILSFNHKSGK